MVGARLRAPRARVGARARATTTRARARASAGGGASSVKRQASPDGIESPGPNSDSVARRAPPRTMDDVKAFVRSHQGGPGPGPGSPGPGSSGPSSLVLRPVSPCCQQPYPVMAAYHGGRNWDAGKLLKADQLLAWRPSTVHLEGSKVKLALGGALGKPPAAESHSHLETLSVSSRASF